MIIDAHSHLWDQLTGNVGVDVRPLKNGMIRMGDDQCLGMPPYLLDGRNPCETMMAFMDAAGVQAAVVTQEYLDGNQNAYLADVAKRYPDRFYVHGLLEFRTPDELADEFAEVTDAYDFKAIKLPSCYLAEADPRIAITDSRIMAIFEKMEKQKMLLAIDLDSGASQVEEMREAARAFPKLTITLGHFAMANRPDWHVQLALANEPNVYVESGGITWLFREEGPPFPGAQRAFEEALQRVGADKLMWGSDYPRTLCDFTYEQTLDFLIDGCKSLSDADRRALLGENAARVFGFQTPEQEKKRPTKITEMD